MRVKQLSIFVENQPGRLAQLAKTLGDAGVNIGGMQVSRQAVGGQAVMVLTVDAAAGSEVLASIATEIDATQVVGVDLL